MDYFAGFSVAPPSGTILVKHVCPACRRMIEESEPKYARIVCPRCRERIVFRGGVAVEHRPKREQ
jgi:DNA-directed RNA polymerase subunit RPC12/RpoP